MRRRCGSNLAPLFLVALAAPRACGADYVASILPIWAGYEDTIGTAVDGGSQVGRSKDLAFLERAILWNGPGSLPTDLTPDGFFESYASGVSGGRQVGFGLNATTFAQNALLWSGSAASVVNLNPAGYSSAAMSIDGDHQVGFGGSPALAGTHALLWRGAAAGVGDLHPSAFNHTYALAVSGATQGGYGVVGSPGNWTNHALMWTGTAASVVDLNPAGFAHSHCLAVSGGTQVGMAFNNGDNRQDAHAMLWNGTAASAVDLHPVGYSTSRAYGAAGALQVGMAAADADGLPHAFVWRGSASYSTDLHDKLSAFPFALISSWAQDVDEHGNIVGFASDANARSYAVLWTPVPEPRALAMMVIAALSGLQRRRRGAIARESQSLRPLSRVPGAYA